MKKRITENIYQQKINQILDYINANLHHPLRLDMMAAQVHVSQRQLIRIMRSVLNEPLSSYIARQRVERAVMYMYLENAGLAKLAEMVGYDNPQSFSKAFKKQFGISPKMYIKELHDKIQGCAESSARHSRLHSEICTEEDIDLVYIRVFGRYGEAEPYEAAWNKLIFFLKENQALSEKTRFIGISFDDPNVTKHEQCRFYACASVARKIVPAGEFGCIRLYKGRYAVYTLEGSCSGLQELYNNIRADAEYTVRYGAAFEEYLNFSGEEEHMITKVYIPIE